MKTVLEWMDGDSQHEQHISLSIEDNSSGFDLSNFNSGNGIQNMKNGSELLNGSFNLEANVGEGTSTEYW